MSSWSIFRKLRIVIFVLTAITSLFLTVLFSLFASKDFHRYTLVQKIVVVGLAIIDGVTAILMYLMVVVSYNTKLDALRIVVLLVIQAVWTTMFTLHSPDIPCDAFGGGSTCRQLAFYAAIISWVLSGLLVTYGCCLIVITFVPKPPPIVGLELGLDDEVPINKSASRKVAHLSIVAPPLQANIVPTERSPFSGRPWPDMSKASGVRFIEKPRTDLVQQPLSPRGYGAVAPTAQPSRTYEAPRFTQIIPYRPADASRQTRAYDLQGRLGSGPYPELAQRMQTPTSPRTGQPPLGPYPESIPRSQTRIPGSIYTSSSGSSRSSHAQPDPYSDPTPRTQTQTPGSTYTSSSGSSGPSTVFTGAPGFAYPPLPPIAQLHPNVRPSAQRTRSSSFTNASVYSQATTAETRHLPPVPYGAQTPSEQSLRSNGGSSDSGSSEWRALIMRAASSRKEGSF